MVCPTIKGKSNMQSISVYTHIIPGTHHVAWQEGDPIILVHVHRSQQGTHLCMPGVGTLIMHQCVGSCFADYMRILLDDECTPGLACHRDPKGRWQGITKVVV